jgi:hypothetical protein
MKLLFVAASLAMLASAPSFAQAPTAPAPAAPPPAATPAPAAAPAAAAPVNAASLVGTYRVTGTETDGRKYDSAGEVVVTMDRSGALDIKWDGGEYRGVAQIIGNTLAIGSLAEGRLVIGLMNIKPDGSLEGRWWRRTDAGTKGTEVWTKK